MTYSSASMQHNERQMAHVLCVVGKQTSKSKMIIVDMFTCQSHKSRIMNYFTEKLITCLLLMQFLNATLQ